MSSIGRSKHSGITLLETMVSLTLGLAIVSVSFNLYTSNRTVFKRISGMVRLQESAHAAAALLSADIRQAGGSLCRKGLPTTHIVNSSAWWAQPAKGIEGFDSSQVDSRASQTSYPRKAGDSLTVWSGNADTATLVAAANQRTRQNSGGTSGGATGKYVIQVNDASGFGDGDLIVLCDYNLALVAQSTLPSSGTVGSLQVLFNTAADAKPGNCGAAFKASSTGIAALPSCATALPAYTASSPTTVATDYTWDTGSMVGKLTSHHWYIGQKTTPSGVTLNDLVLRRLTINYDHTSKAISTTPTSEEMVENVSDMQITYLVGTDTGYPSTTNYVTATGVTDWTKVIAARIVLTLKSTEAIAVNASGAAAVATYTTMPITVAIRSRLPNTLVTK